VAIGVLFNVGGGIEGHLLAKMATVRAGTEDVRPGLAVNQRLASPSPILLCLIFSKYSTW